MRRLVNIFEHFYILFIVFHSHAMQLDITHLVTFSVLAVSIRIRKIIMLYRPMYVVIFYVKDINHKNTLAIHYVQIDKDRFDPQKDIERDIIKNTHQ